MRPEDPKSLKRERQWLSAGPVRPLAAALSSDQPHLAAMAHLSITRSSRDPADRKTSGEADAAARPAMVAVIAPDASDRKTSGEADAEARPGMTAFTSRDPSDRETSGEADTEARPAMSAMRSRTPSVYQASTKTGHEASLVMSTRASGTPADDRDSTEADPAASDDSSIKDHFCAPGLDGDWSWGKFSDIYICYIGGAAWGASDGRNVHSTSRRRYFQF